ncbi:MAG TPA: hypothetical protein VGN57_08285 [Pirellulaceae bacterium]|jgi:hypothetical protein|nr:hypothetical protein [Pirellulaceae bacterium]
MAHRIGQRVRAALCWSLCFISACSLHADHVLVEPDDPRDPPTKIEGTILERTGSGVTIQTAPGRTQEIPGEKVVAVEAKKSDGQRNAEELLAKHQFAEAFDALVDAETRERREWVKREILALAAAARREQGDRLGAAKFGLYLLENDPASPHADALPLVWQDEPLGVPEREAAKGWFDSESEPAQLLAASWLLGDPEFAAAAQAKLRTLSGSIDRIVATLAKLQLARRDPSQSPAVLAALVDKLPAGVKAGPYWLLGREYERSGNVAAARIAYLRSGLGFHFPRELVASALVAAARSGANGTAGTGQAAAAAPASERARLLQFAVERGGNTTSGREARALLESLRSEAARSR